MIKNLKINNVAIIDSLDISFEKGLNALTGETGAGKSIIFDSLNFLLGDRADKTLIRYGQNSAKVCGIFLVDQNQDSIKSTLEKYDLEYSDEIYISRTMSLDGKNEIKINGESVTLGILKDLSQHLVDIYGQNDHQFLLKQKNHLSFLDSFGSDSVNKLKIDYSSTYSQIKSIDKTLQGMGGTEEERLREIDYLEYQIKELENANLSETEEDELITERKKLSNMEKIVDSTSKIQNELDQYILPTISNICSEISSANNYDSTLSEIKERFETLKIEASVLFDDIADYNSSASFDESHFEEVDNRLDLYNSIKRKYNMPIIDILENLTKLKERHNLLINITEEREKLFKQRKALISTALEIALKLHKQREIVAENLQNLIKKELADLGMKNAQIKFIFKGFKEDEFSLSSNGLDDIELNFSANLGEPVKPLTKIISGGEMSRLMLAIKTVVARTDNMPTMIFDEIESGISGEMAQAVAKKMAKIATCHQVIVITHSQHIASMADEHYLIKKLEKDGTTTSSITKLSEEERIAEIARFIATDSTLKLAQENAKALLDSQKEYKQNLSH